MSSLLSHVYLYLLHVAEDIFKDAFFLLNTLCSFERVLIGFFFFFLIWISVGRCPTWEGWWGSCELDQSRSMRLLRPCPRGRISWSSTGIPWGPLQFGCQICIVCFTIARLCRGHVQRRNWRSSTKGDTNQLIPPIPTNAAYFVLHDVAISADDGYKSAFYVFMYFIYSFIYWI